MKLCAVCGSITAVREYLESYVEDEKLFWKRTIKISLFTPNTLGKSLLAFKTHG